ncbi:phosphoglycolate phosphatase [Thiogranum longum]|uniref:phosphoglycolate phosphatase n=1 Tax=Thiogranum longum TaxID=1537524 RepID=A0A4R1H8B2_9GAMM|nr:phosphoglycolate phosphatase [Thiogranum longum]TCK18077.1 phosphoglycolate phosphatase [Thiogranum longum]
MAAQTSAVLFDLDGTLLDTAPDLAAALNATLQLNERDALPFETIRPVVSHGGRALIELGFGIDSQHPDFEPLRKQLLDLYQANLAVHTALFPGMGEVLDELEQRHIRWGVVTNKPGWLTDPLLDALNLAQRTACIVSGDTLPERKPHPAPLLHACKLVGCQPQDAIYIGDAERDIEAGRNAGMRTLVALFGYLMEHDRPENWGADALIEQPADILEHLDTTRTQSHAG